MEEEKEGELGGSWTILDKKHTLLFNHVYSNNKEGNLKYHEKITQALDKNPEEESIDLEYTEKEDKEWISQWKLRTVSSDQILEKIITKIQKAEKGKKIEKMNLKAKGIYIGKYKLDDVEYPIAIYSEKDIIDNIVKVQVNEISELEKEENQKHIKAEETFIKYMVIAFYEEGKKEPVLIIQIEKFDISKLQNTKKKWLEFLKILKGNLKIMPGNPLIEMIIVHNNSAPTSGGMFGCARVGNGCEQTTIPNLPKYDNNKKVHDGIDLYAPLNTDIYAMYDGEIVFIENSVPQNEQGTVGALGNRILIKHTSNQHKKNNNTIYVMYGHLNVVEKNIQSGTKVKQGQKIGMSGKTGNAFDIEAWRYHVHLMIYENGTSSENKVDPRKYLTTKFDQNGNKIE